ncbi:hypothetical protein MLD38_017174 [Melastoma candidum]|uniref:Uncharacterized protein n=1 Tax=Melastoma candidum TaxID=119954 RepID=A0ACB9QPY7_9MYRT|nr:hypothetical protein MLD38_017174 [Melastoma candidum]
MQSETISGLDHLDRLPDELLLAIFARIRDVRTLVGLLSLCRRFRSLVPLSDSVSLSFPWPQPVVRPHKSRPSFSKNPLGFLLDRILRNPIRRLVSAKSRGGRANYYDEVGIVGDITERLRVFSEARDVRVILPCEGGLSEKDGTFLRWRASYGSQIRSCIILGASGVRSIEEELLQEKAASNGEEGPEEMLAPTSLSDSELKLRVVWIISCLIAASYRHYMMRKVIAACPGLRTMVVGDERRQGRVVMGEDEVSDTRREDNECVVQDDDENTLERSKAPELRMKLWHAPSLELPKCRRVLKGATLVVIYPAAGDASCITQDRHEDSILQRGIEDEDEEEDEVFVEAVKELRKRNKSYLMEMNSF